MGWKPVGFSEIEKFPSQVLAYHYPTVTNFGDMTKYKEWNLNDSIGLLVGGTPCQSFSVAGLRKGLDDPRGNLALTYVGILDKFRPKWCIWENVPGVLSSGGGRDFGSFLGALDELGYGWAYRVLDAQNFGVAQRRRRVFVVGCLGDWRAAAEVLFESESLRGNIKESKNKGEEVARCITTRSATNLCSETGNFVTNASYSFDDHREGLRIYKESTSTLCAAAGTGGGNVPLTMAIQGNLIGRDKGGPQGIGVSEGETMYTLTKADVHGVAFGWQNSASQGMSVDTISPTLDKSKTPATMQNMAVRRLTPVECERLQGFPDDYTNIKENCPDGPRYKALGNSMAVPVMRWIGERINQYEQRGVEKHL
jgi:DNA (cytosine-5)-methyltransferase 1